MSTNNTNNANDPKTITCECCGEIIDDDYWYTVRDRYGIDHIWCEECTYTSASYCEHCETWHDDSVQTYDVYTDYTGYNYETWCERCVQNDSIECEHCGTLYSVGRIDCHDVYDGGTQYICESCISDVYYQCEGCGQLVHCDDVETIDYDNYCLDCAREIRESANLRSYGTTYGTVFWNDNGACIPAYDLYRLAPRTLFLGIELETDNNDSDTALADDIIYACGSDHMECKHDGSLYDNGVEIVSLPMTPLYHLQSGIWEDVARVVRAHGGTSHDAGTCGLHIHASRSYFKDSESAVYRLDRIFHRFQNEMVTFSRRTESQLHWCAIRDYELDNITDTCERKSTWSQKKRYSGRYEAINDTNTSTVEVRLWRGTLNIETLRATIEFTAGLMMVANHITDDMCETVTWSQLKTLVHTELYNAGIPHDDLRAYLRRRSL